MPTYPRRPHSALDCPILPKTDPPYPKFETTNLIILHSRADPFNPRLTRNYVYLEKEVTEFLAKVEKKKGWLTQYSRAHNYSSPFRIDEVSRRHI